MMKNNVVLLLARVLLVVLCTLFVKANDNQRQRSLNTAQVSEHWNNLKSGKSNALSISRVYANASAKLPRSSWDYEDGAPFEYGSWNRYDLGGYLAHGNYSEVYACTERATGTACVMKVLHMASAASNRTEGSFLASKTFRGSKDANLKREISILRRVGGRHNTTRLMDVLAGPGPSELTMVLERVALVTDNAFFQSRNLADVRFYASRMVISNIPQHTSAHA